MKQLKVYEKQALNGVHPYQVLLMLIDDMERWRQGFKSEYFGLIYQYAARLMIMSSITDGKIHGSSEVSFSSSREFLEKSLKSLSIDTQLESFWLDALTYREQYSIDELVPRLEVIIEGRSERVENSYRLFAARELAIFQYENDFPKKDIRKTLNIIELNIDKIIISAKSYCYNDYDSIEKVITMWAFLDLSLKTGNLQSAEKFVRILEDKVPLKRLVPKLHKVMVSDFYRSLYMFHIVKGNFQKAEYYDIAHSSLCKTYELENSMRWISRIKRLYDLDN